jgi:hypothetical protein
MFEEAKRRARTTIQTNWRKIADNYTFGWSGPIQVVEKMFPDFVQGISEIKSRVSPGLPIVIYQSRESPPKSMSLAIPYVGMGNNPYNSRLLSSENLPNDQRQLLCGFAQAFWFSIDQKMLPRPERVDALEKKLIEWTDSSLLKL